MKKNVCLLAILSLFCFMQTPSMAQTPNDYKQMWKKVSALSSKGLPKSAMQVIDSIYSKASDENNSNQIIKSVIFRVNFTESYEENALVKSVTATKKDLGRFQFPVDNLLHLYLGDMYFSYLRSNYWRIQGRTLVSDADSLPIEEWSLPQFYDTIRMHYNAALNNPAGLVNIPVDAYPELISKDSVSYKLRPALLDVLVYHIIEKMEYAGGQYFSQFTHERLDADTYLSTSRDFLSVDISVDKGLYFQNMQYFQILAQQRHSEKDTLALLHCHLQRLDIARKHIDAPQKEKRYFNALGKLRREYKGHPALDFVNYQMALVYYSNYTSNRLDTVFVRPLVKADNILNAIDTQYPYLESQTEWLINKIHAHSLNMQAENELMPGKAFPVQISYRNLDSAYMAVIPIDSDGLWKLTRKYHNTKDVYHALYHYADPVWTQAIDLPEASDLEAHSTECIAKSLQAGEYVLLLSANPDFEYADNLMVYKPVVVSGIAYTFHRCANGAYDVYISDRETGNPLKAAKVEILRRKYNYILNKTVYKKSDTRLTNTAGYVRILERESDYNQYVIEISHEEQKIRTDSYFYSYYSYYNERGKEPVYHIFTDRSVYRPGQNLQFKLICLQGEAGEQQLLKNYRATVRLYDANGQVVEEDVLVSNEFGSMSGSFDIPRGRLNGNWSLRVGQSNKHIRVEEYKRPAFTAKMQKLDGDYRIGEEVALPLRAESYSGVAITDAKVTYRIYRQPDFRFYSGWTFGYAQREEVAYGTGQTNADGSYDICFTPEADPEYPIDPDIVYTYYIEAEVTDLTGETQAANASFSVGFRALHVKLDVPGKMLYPVADTFHIQSLNMNGEEVDSKGLIRFTRLVLPENPVFSRKWNAPDKPMYSKEEWENALPGYEYSNEAELSQYPELETAWKFRYNTRDTTAFLIPKKEWEPGYYCIEVRTEDAFGLPIVEKQYMRLVHTGKKQLGTPDMLFAQLEKIRAEPGETVDLWLGTAAKRTKVIFELVQGDDVLRQEVVQLNDKLVSIPLKVKESWRGGMGIRLHTVRENRLFSELMTLHVPFTNKNLHFNFTHFRDAMEPGAEEKIILTISGPDKEKEAAELMAGMYDASLDKISAHYWYMNLRKYYYAGSGNQASAFNTAGGRYAANDLDTIVYNVATRLPQISWYGVNPYSSYGYGYFRGGSGIYSASAEAQQSFGGATLADGAVEQTTRLKESEKATGAKSKAPVRRKMSTATFSPSAGADQDRGVRESSGEKNEKSKSDVQIRSDFRETAFFKPHLQMNEEGNYEICFTAPERLTRYRVMGLAHTQDLKTGTFTKEISVRKKLMMEVNPPRFFREEDRISLSIKLMNTSEEALKGDLTIRFTDPISGEDIARRIIKPADSVQEWALQAGENKAYSLDMKIPEGLQALRYTLIARSPEYGDGETRILPVLSNRMLVTESKPLFVKTNEAHSFKMEKLLQSGDSKTIRHHKFSIEFTPNPAWYAVQAIPYMMEYPHECAEQIFSRYYANTLAGWVANSDPRIKEVFEVWKNIPGQNALQSNLEKNQDLKAVMLRQTPWVLQAKNEAQRKRRIALLFDIDKMSGMKAEALHKLKKMQKANGGWPWFEGMPESRYITQHIVAGLGHLKHLGVWNTADYSENPKLIANAISFIDDEILDDYKRLKRYYTKEEMENHRLSYTDIHYLYARSFFIDDIEIDGRHSEAWEYYQIQAAKYWAENGFYMQGMICLTKMRTGEQDLARGIIHSLKEHAIYHDEKGMYWKRNRGYYWYQAPVERQALLIEAFNEIGGESASVELMKQWLLVQKRTQDWRTTKATSEAVYALLLTGKDLLSAQPSIVIEVGGERLLPDKDRDIQQEAGTGYFRKTWNGKEVGPEMGEVKIRKSDKSVSWGAMYWQYFEDLDKITHHETPLKLKKQLYRMDKAGGMNSLSLLDDKEKLQPGDKLVVRLVLETDRRMEYVHMKDMRAAALEPVYYRSGYRYQDGLGYYESIHDASVDYFFSSLSPGKYVFEYPLYVTHAGSFSNGITSIQCMYAPEYTAHSKGHRIIVEK